MSKSVILPRKNSLQEALKAQAELFAQELAAQIPELTRKKEALEKRIADLQQEIDEGT